MKFLLTLVILALTLPGVLGGIRFIKDQSNRSIPGIVGIFLPVAAGVVLALTVLYRNMIY